MTGESAGEVSTLPPGTTEETASQPRSVLIVKAEALEEEAARMEAFGHPEEWPERLRNRAQFWRARADEQPGQQPVPVRQQVAEEIAQAIGELEEYSKDLTYELGEVLIPRDVAARVAREIGGVS